MELLHNWLAVNVFYYMQISKDYDNIWNEAEMSVNADIQYSSYCNICWLHKLHLIILCFQDNEENIDYQISHQNVQILFLQ